MIYQRKEELIEAIQWKGIDNFAEVCKFLGKAPKAIANPDFDVNAKFGRPREPYIGIDLGPLNFLSIGGYIIKGNGGFFAVGRDWFENNYEPKK